MSREDDIKKLELKMMIPGYIMDLNLFKGNEASRFDKVNGGVFRCPICGKRIALFLKDNATKDPYGINNFAHCTHFGSNGEYSSDIFGLYAAVNRISQKESFNILMDGKDLSFKTGNRTPISFVKDVNDFNKRNSREKETIDKHNADNLKKAQWGKEISKEGKALLRKRGISEEVLNTPIGNYVGYAPSVTLKSRSGKPFKTEGIVFALGKEKNLSFQIRRTRENCFVSKSDRDFRFFSVSDTEPFNMDAIINSSENSPLFVTEGPFDALSFTLFSVNAVATIGAANHKKILSALRETDKKMTVVLCFDKDSAGIKGAEQLKREIEENGIKTIIFPSTPDKTDFNDYICNNRKSAEQRVVFAKALACSLSHNIINEDEAKNLIKNLEDADKEKNGSAYCTKATEYLRKCWRKNA